MKKYEAKPVDPTLLSKYVISSEDSIWVEGSVDVAFFQTPMNWTDSTSKARNIAIDISKQVERRFSQRFPTFNDEVQEHTVRGRSACLPMFLWFIAWPAIIVLGMVFIDWRFLSTLIPALLGILVIAGILGAPWLWMKGLGWASGWAIPDAVPAELMKSKEAWIAGMNTLIRDAVDAKARGKFYESTSLEPTELLASVGGRWQPFGPRPLAPAKDMSPRDAEVYVAAYMKFYGAKGVAETRFSRDGGIDVTSALFIAQVKHQEGNVGVKPLRELFGIATAKKQIPLFFAKRGYTKEALEFARDNGMALFTYLPHLQAVSQTARPYIERGMGSI